MDAAEKRAPGCCHGLCRAGMGGRGEGHLLAEVLMEGGRLWGEGEDGRRVIKYFFSSL